MGNLAFTWKSQGRLSDALEVMQNCLHLRQRVLGLYYPYTVSPRSTLTNWLNKEGNGMMTIQRRATNVQGLSPAVRIYCGNKLVFTQQW